LPSSPSPSPSPSKPPSLVKRPKISDLGASVLKGAKDWAVSLPSTRRQAFFDWLRRHKKALLTGLIISATVSGNYYYTHLQTTPITKRSRFIALTKDQFAKVCQTELDQIREKYRGSIVPVNDPRTKRVVYILSRVVSRNRSIPEVNRLWNVAVIESEEKHAKSISTGYIFISTGLIGYVTNDDQLGILLSHEMAHALLQHDLEKISWAMLMQTLWQGVTNVLLSFTPTDLAHKVVDATRDKILDVIANLPYGRLLEREADQLGLQLAARACFDPREAYSYWSGFTPNPSSLDMNPILAKWIYHHPNYGDRSERLEKLMEEMCEIRSKAGCPSLTKCDPCALLEMKRRLGHMDEAMKEGCPL